MNPIKQDIAKAQQDFEETIGACYIYLTKNGLKSEYVEEMLKDSMEGVIKNIKERGL